VVAALVAVLLVVAAARLLRTEQHYAGSNSVGPKQAVATLRAGDRVCQVGELVPRDAATVELAVTTGGEPGPPLEATLRDERGRTFARGSTRKPYGDGFVGMPIPVQRQTRTGVEACFESTGAGAAQLLGLANAQGRLELDGKPQAGVLRVAFRRPGRESWLAFTPTIADRFDVAKTRLAGNWTFWAVMVLVLGIAGLGIRETLRDEEAPA